MADCWTCGAERGRAAFCPTCKKIQPVVRNTSYFESLGLKEKMGLTRSELEKAYRKQAQRVHPDRFGQASRMERKLALEQTTHLNDAYQTLKTPRTRGEYLMKRAGHEVGTEEHRVDDMEFLMEMMTLRESLETARSIDEVRPLRDDVEARHDRHLDGLQAYFDEAKGSEASALKSLEQLRFLERFLHEVDAKFDA